MAATIVGPVSNVSPGLPGGVSAALNLTGAEVIKAAPGVLYRVSVITPGTGTLTLNDVTTTGDAAPANEIASIPAASLTAGQVIALNWPCAAGITASAVPSGGQFAVSFS